MDELMLDGNAVAGALQQAFAIEITTAVATCNGCGESEPVGAVRVYIGAGIVLRCPHCDTVLVKTVQDGDRMWLAFPGIEALELRT